MNRRQIILYYRTNRMLKGHKPAIVSLKKNIGKIYKGTQADFIMTLGKEYLQFQRISFFTKKLLPEQDFKIALKRIKSYRFEKINVAIRKITFYTFENFFLEIEYASGTSDTYEGETNISDTLKALESMGVKEIKDEGTDL